MKLFGRTATLTLGLLALGLAAPAHAERVIVEPITTVESEGFSQAELDQMLAPIALYPDALLSQVLIASTYPLEIVAAARWSRQNPGLQGEAAVQAVADRDWDPSVKSLVAFPDLLARLDEDLDWTRRLGDAMLFQEAAVMDSIQFLRARADAAGHLDNTEYVRVIREEKTIIIEPAQTRVVHVPYYDPWVVYGAWWRPAYPPVVWARPAYYYYGPPGFYWSTGIHISPGFLYSSFYWPHRSVVIVHTPRYYYPPRHRHVKHSYTPGQRWKHNPVHRRGVGYRHPEVRQRYDQPRLRAGPTTRFPLEGGTRTDRQWHRDGERRTDGLSRRQPTGSANSRDGSETRLQAGPRTAPNRLAAGAAPRGDASSERSLATGRQSTPRPDERNVAAPQPRNAAPAIQPRASSTARAAPTQRFTQTQRAAPPQQATRPQSAAPPRAAPSQSRAVPQRQSSAATRFSAPRQSTATVPAERRASPAAGSRPSAAPSAVPPPARQPGASNRSGSRPPEARSAPSAPREARAGGTPRGGLGRAPGRRPD